MGRVICQIYRLYKQITSGAVKKIRTSHFLEFLNPPKTHHTRMTVNTCNRPNFKILPLFKSGDAGTESLELQQKRRYKSRLNSWFQSDAWLFAIKTVIDVDDVLPLHAPSFLHCVALNNVLRGGVASSDLLLLLFAYFLLLFFMCAWCC